MEVTITNENFASLKAGDQPLVVDLNTTERSLSVSAM